MSYAISYSLQKAIFTYLAGEAALYSLVGAHIFDVPPPGGKPSTFVLIGEETVLDRSSKTNYAALHEFIVSVNSDAAGFGKAKEVAATVCDTLLDAKLSLDRGHVTGIWFRNAKAVRGKSPDRRRIDLRFRAYVEDN
jgi:hypothetical protein